MKLYYAPGACSLAAHIMAEEEGLPLSYERVDLKTHTTSDGRDFRQINPKGYVPALELDDHGLLTENVAILPYLADRMPDSGLAPKDAMGRTRLLEWLGFLSTELHKPFAPLFHGKDETAQSAARDAIAKRLTFIDEQKGPNFLMGPQFSAADAYLFVMLLWCGKMKITLPGALAEYRDKIAARPAVKRAMTEEGLI